MKATCRGCHAIIRWLRTPAGKSIPVDPERNTFWYTDEPGPPRLSVVTADGAIITGKRGSVLSEGARSVEGYNAHWVTCPKAKEFRR